MGYHLQRTQPRAISQFYFNYHNSEGYHSKLVIYGEISFAIQFTIYFFTTTSLYNFQPNIVTYLHFIKIDLAKLKKNLKF